MVGKNRDTDNSLVQLMAETRGDVPMDRLLQMTNGRLPHNSYLQHCWREAKKVLDHEVAVSKAARKLTPK